MSVLGALRATEAVPALISVLEDGDATLVTLRALAHIGDTRATAPLHNLIETPIIPLTEEVRQYAMERLIDFGLPGALAQ